MDSQRLQGHVQRGQSAQARYVPWPEAPLTLLRLYWQAHRTQTWLLPAPGRAHKQMATATEPMSRHRVQGALRKAQRRAGITKLGEAWS